MLAHQGAWALLAAAAAWHTGALSIGGALLAARRSLGATEFAFKSFYLVMLSVCFSFGRTALAHPPGSVDRIAGYVQVVVYIVPLSFVWPNRAKVFGLLARLFASRPPLMVHTSSSDLGDLLSGRSEGGDAAAAQWDAFVGGVSGRSEG